MSNLKISLGTKEVTIQDRFTLIKGKIKKDLLANYKNKFFIKISEDFNKIPIKKYIDVFQDESQKNYELKKAIKLLDFIHDYRKILIKNIELCSNYNEINENLISSLRFITLFKKKELLAKELEISEKQQKSSDFQAIMDLSKKLSESIQNNQNRLHFLERDYFRYKNQINQIKETINEYKLKIQEFNKQKKSCFSQINRITREMSGDSQEQEEVLNEISNSGENLTYAEKIKSFQKKAKDIQFEINEINSRISKIKLNLEELTPPYETYKADYKKISELIKNEEKKIIDLKFELKKKKIDNNIPTQELELINLQSLRSSQEIREQIQNVITKANELFIPGGLYNSDNPYDLSLIYKKLKELEVYLNKQESKLVIKKTEKEITDCFENFRKLEFILNKGESLMNKFLQVIKLKSQFRITLNSNDKNFFIIINFTRNNKEQILFDELTTPEKIFFIIVFYISIKLQSKIENVIFSNLFIPRKYNKAGSIFRTIRKILPIFENDEELFRFKLIFIISDLEMKKQIKELKVIRLQES